MDLSLMNH